MWIGLYNTAVWLVLINECHAEFSVLLKNSSMNLIWFIQTADILAPVNSQNWICFSITHTGRTQGSYCSVAK